MSAIFNAHLDDLKKLHPTASGSPLQDGSFLVVVPDIALPAGWNRSSTTIRFIAPVAYPVARPDCFWADHGLALADGRIPQNTGPNPCPGTSVPLLWFSWHVALWSPNTDDLITYLNVIERRFADLK